METNVYSLTHTTYKITYISQCIHYPCLLDTYMCKCMCVICVVCFNETMFDDANAI